MRTVRKKGKQTEIHWIESLKEIKYELNTKNYKKITPLFRDRNITGTWTGYMHKKNILYKDNFGYWRFEDITIDDRIVQMFRKYSNELAKKNRLMVKNMKMLKSDLFTNIKEPIKTKNIVSVQKKEEIGLIRKFIKWLW
jgi:hypothetical protein